MREQFLKQAGSIQGAIWYFKLTPVGKTSGRDAVIHGAYRVSDLKIYQAEKPGGEWTKQIGQTQRTGAEKKAKAEFTLLRGKTAAKQWAKPLKGKALLTLVEFGKLQGEFVDSDGFRWKMRTMRIRE